MLPWAEPARLCDYPTSSSKRSVYTRSAPFFQSRLFSCPRDQCETYKLRDRCIYSVVEAFDVSNDLGQDPAELWARMPAKTSFMLDRVAELPPRTFAILTVVFQVFAEPFQRGVVRFR